MKLEILKFTWGNIKVYINNIPKQAHVAHEHVPV